MEKGTTENISEESLMSAIVNTQNAISIFNGESALYEYNRSLAYFFNELVRHNIKNLEFVKRFNDEQKKG
jgi:hypothetical protein